jgi:hypothetical protein
MHGGLLDTAIVDEEGSGACSVELLSGRGRSKDLAKVEDGCWSLRIIVGLGVAVTVLMSAFWSADFAGVGLLAFRRIRAVYSFGSSLVGKAEQVSLLKPRSCSPKDPVTDSKISRV